MQKKTHLIAIDNAAIGNLQFVRYGELPFVRMVFWRQFHAFDEGFVKAYVPRMSPSIKLALEKLDEKTLEIIFQDSKGMDFFTKSYLKAILERRDQVLNHG